MQNFLTKIENVIKDEEKPKVKKRNENTGKLIKICNEFNNQNVVEFSYWCKVKEPIFGSSKVKIITTKKKKIEEK